MFNTVPAHHKGMDVATVITGQSFPKLKRLPYGTDNNVHYHGESFSCRCRGRHRDVVEEALGSMGVFTKDDLGGPLCLQAALML